MEVSGRIKKIMDPQTFGSGFRKRELVLVTQEQYPQQLLIEFTQDRIDLLNSFGPEDEVKISINLRGREWINPEGVAKYFNAIQGWRIEKGMAEADAPAAAPTPAEQPAQDLTANSKEETFDDLPF